MSIPSVIITLTVHDILHSCFFFSGAFFFFSGSSSSGASGTAVSQGSSSLQTSSPGSPLSTWGPADRAVLGLGGGPSGMRFSHPGLLRLLSSNPTPLPKLLLFSSESQLLSYIYLIIIHYLVWIYYQLKGRVPVLNNISAGLTLSLPFFTLWHLASLV